MRLDGKTAEERAHFWWPGSRLYTPTGNGHHRLEQRFAAYDGERLYGLGQHQHGLFDQKGASDQHALRAGRDTAEWAIECADVKPIAKHGSATIFSSWDNVRPGSITCQGHSFVANLPIDRGAYREMLLEWLPSAPNVLGESSCNHSSSRSLNGGSSSATQASACWC